jgi:AraC-like DNA-binding protein
LRNLFCALLVLVIRPQITQPVGLNHPANLNHRERSHPMDYRIRIVIQSLEVRLIPPPCNSQAVTEKYLHQLRDELAADVKLSPSRLCALFKAATGQSFIQYAKNWRIKKACDLVTGTDLQITEIADQLSYPDFSHFIREFKQAFGLAPLAYRHFSREREG